MITKVARHTFNEIIGVPDYRKAVALAIYVKDRKGASVWKDWSYRKIAAFCGISPTTCHKRIAILIKLGIVDAYTHKGHSYLKFNKLRQGEITIKKKKGEVWFEKQFQPRTADVSIKEISHDTIKDIERGLMALLIVEDIRRKDYVRQLITSAHDPKPGTSAKRIKRAKAKCKERGYGRTFVDGGLSYRAISRKLHCAPNTTKDVIAYGESIELFEATRRDWILWLYAGYGRGHEALSYLKEEGGEALFATRSNVWYKPSLVFSLTGDYHRSI